MLNAVKHLWSRYKPYWITVIVSMWASAIFFALQTNPSVAEAHAKLMMMKQDMDAVLAEGGKIVSTEENAKYGSAIVLRSLHVEGWSSELVKRYEEALLRKNWRPLAALPHSYCKEGVLAKITPNAGMENGHSVNAVNMVFNPATIKQCSSTR